MNALLPPVIDEPGLADRIKANPEQLLAECAAEHGDVFTVAVGPEHRITYVLDPHLYHAVLTAREVDFAPVSRQSKLRFGLGSIVATDDGVHQLSRAFIGGLRGPRLSETVTVFTQALRETVDTYAAGLGDGQQRTVQHLVAGTLMPATVRALFGPGIYDDGFEADFTTFNGGMATRFAGSEPTLSPEAADAEASLLHRLETALKTLPTPALKEVSRRFIGEESVTTGEKLRTLLVLLWGSMVNLLPTTAWMYSQVVADPELVAELRREEATEAGTSLRSSIATETLRLHSRPNMYRVVQDDFDLEVEGRETIHFTGGDWVALFPRFLHHDASVFPAPDAFDARRFMPDEGDPLSRPPQFERDGQRLKHATMVFGAGRGRCPGDGYTMSVLDAVLRAWTSTFDARLLDGAIPPAITDTVSSTPGPSRDIGVFLSPASDG